MYDLTEVAKFYDRLVESQTDDAAAVGWRNPYMQDVAFLALAQIDGLVNGVRVLDLGCGLGAMKGFFERRGLEVDYTGYDISPRMIEGARARHPDGRFEVRNILESYPQERFDFVLCSGALSFKVENHGQFVRDMIRAMYNLCDTALAFNMLSGYMYMLSPAAQRNPLELDYGWPDVTFRFCKLLTKHVVISQAAHSRRYDVVLYKRNRTALRRYLELARPGKVWGPDVQAAIDYHGELNLFEDLRDFLLGIEPCAPVYAQLGQVLATLGQLDQAVAVLDQAIAADRTSAAPHVTLGRIALQRKELSAAIDHFGRALVADPDHSDARDELVRALVKSGRKGEARGVAARMPPGPHADFLQALVAVDDAGVEAALNRALAAAPRYLEALIQAAWLYERTGRRKQALEMWERAQLVAPVDKSIADRIAALVATR